MAVFPREIKDMWEMIEANSKSSDKETEKSWLCRKCVLKSSYKLLSKDIPLISKYIELYKWAELFH